MIEIKNLLNKFSKLIDKEEFKKEIIINSINQSINLKIKKEDVIIKGDVLYLKIKPIYKNEILIKKEKIIFNLNNSLNKRKINKII